LEKYFKIILDAGSLNTGTHGYIILTLDQHIFVIQLSDRVYNVTFPAYALYSLRLRLREYRVFLDVPFRTSDILCSMTSNICHVIFYVLRCLIKENPVQYF
jgi:hypothetical protein